MPRPAPNSPTPNQIEASAIVYKEGKAIELMRELYGTDNTSLNRANYWALHLTLMDMEKRLDLVERSVNRLAYYLRDLIKQNKLDE